MKFVFSILIVMFHYSTHFGFPLFPGGRIAVEGYFMISGFFMMRSIKRQKKERSLGADTVHFIAHKYSALLQFLLPSVIVAEIVMESISAKPALQIVKEIPLLFFEIVPLLSLGYKGVHVIGISWYLSAMLIALAILYPLCKKFKENFILCFGIPAVLMIYGFLSHVNIHLAVPMWLDDFPVPTGILRGIAGCLAGCILYECSERISNKKLTGSGRVLLIALEMCGYIYFFYVIQKYPKSNYDYLLVFLLFGLLLVGISGITGLSKYYSTSKTSVLGTYLQYIVCIESLLLE